MTMQSTPAVSRPAVERRARAAHPADEDARSIARLLARGALFVLVAAIGLSIVRAYPVGIFHDDGVYLVLARSLASGHGFRYLHLPGAPVATHYPPVYPLLLAVVSALAPGFPRDVEWMLMINALFLGGAAVGLARVARLRLGWSEPVTLAVAAAATLALPVVFLSSLVMSEVPFLALLLLSLPWLEREIEAGGSPLRDAGAGALAGALALVRTHALVLVVALAFVLLRRAQWRRAALIVAAAVAVVAPWQLWIALHETSILPALRGSYGSYLGWFVKGIAAGGPALVARTVSINAGEIAALVADRVAPWPLPLARWAVLALGLALAVGGGRALHRRAPVAALFLFGYLAVTLAWPFAPWRFVWAIWPLGVLVVAAGVHALAHAGDATPRIARSRLAAAVVASVVLGTGMLTAESRVYRERAWEQPARDAARQVAPALRWIHTHTAPNDVVIADAEPLVYLVTGRQALPPAEFTAVEYGAHRDTAADRATLRELIRRTDARWLVTIVPSTVAAARALGPELVERDTLPGGAAFEVAR